MSIFILIFKSKYILYISSTVELVLPDDIDLLLKEKSGNSSITPYNASRLYILDFNVLAFIALVDILPSGNG